MFIRAALVTGGREYPDKKRVFQELDNCDPDIVIHGCCPTGADEWAQDWCDERVVAVARFPADWNALKKSAGPIRNSEMVEFARVLAKNVEVIVLSFPGGPGTRDCTGKAERAGLTVKRIS